MDLVIDSRENMQETGGAGLVVVGLGANLGEPQLTLSQAVQRLSEEFVVLMTSPLYRSQPIGPEQPDFLNAAVLLEESRELSEVLQILQGLEKEFHRVREVRWGPRTLDLDILWADRKLSSSSILTVPHKELRYRAFALQPLLDLVPWAKDPRDDTPYQAILPSLKQQRVEQVAQEGWTEALSVLKSDCPSRHLPF